MRRLYVEDDPEDKEYVFVKKNDVYIDDDNTPAKCIDISHVMCCENDCGMLHLIESAYKIPDLALHGNIQSYGRFVKEYDSRIMQKCSQYIA